MHSSFVQVTCEFKKNRSPYSDFFLSPIVINITVCLLDRTYHVVAVQTVTKEEFRSAQTHEFEAIRKILPAVQAKGTLVYCPFLTLNYH